MGIALHLLAILGHAWGEKNFQSMKQSERQLWAAKCDVVWPCRKAFAAAESAQFTASDSIDADCNQDFGKACLLASQKRGAAAQLQQDLQADVVPVCPPLTPLQRRQRTQKRARRLGHAHQSELEFDSMKLRAPVGSDSDCERARAVKTK